MVTRSLGNRRQMVPLRGCEIQYRGVTWALHKVRSLSRLFLILVRHLKLECKTTLFADDTTLVTRPRLLDQLNREASVLLEIAKEWFASKPLFYPLWHLPFNLETPIVKFGFWRMSG